MAPAATAAVMLDVWWNPATMRQAEDRIHRLGTVRACDVYTIVGDGSFDTACRDIYHKFKTNTSAIIVDRRYPPGTTSTVTIREGAEESVFKQITRRMHELDDAASARGAAAAPSEDLSLLLRMTERVD